MANYDNPANRARVGRCCWYLRVWLMGNGLVHDLGPDGECKEEEMTDEERRKLCADLQLIANDEIEGESWTGLKCKEAADEIERLQNELAELRDRCAETQKLAFEWMGRHDKVVGFISKNYPLVMMPNLPFPSPADRSAKIHAD